MVPKLMSTYIKGNSFLASYLRSYNHPKHKQDARTHKIGDATCIVEKAQCSKIHFQILHYILVYRMKWYKTLLYRV